MAPLPVAAREGIRYKRPVEERIEYAIDGVVEESISNGRLVDVSWLRIGDLESLISTMFIRFAFQILVKRKEIAGEIKGILCDILLQFLAPYKLLPSGAQILK